MVMIKYIDGDTENIETLDDYVLHFVYDKESECFVIFNHFDYHNCIHIPREFVKSIRHIEVSDD